MGEGQMMMRSFVEDLVLNGRLGLGWRPLVRVAGEGSHRRSIASRINRTCCARACAEKLKRSKMSELSMYIIQALIH